MLKAIGEWPADRGELLYDHRRACQLRSVSHCAKGHCYWNCLACTRCGFLAWLCRAPSSKRQRAGNAGAECGSRTECGSTRLPIGSDPDAAPAPDFATVSKLMNDAIAANQLPGAVVVIGHGGKVVFHQAYGSRKLAGEPGLDGSPAPAEPMTEDTIFDMASLTKTLATATAVMQLYEQGKVQFDDPVQQYLPDFNTANDPQRAKVTVRMLLTHTSGETGDVDLKDPWGLDGADKTEGIHRALTTPLESGPGEVFRYSDINFILLGALIEKVTGEAEDVYVQQNVFAPLGMEDTRYLPPAKACGPHTMRGAAIAWAPAPTGARAGRLSRRYVEHQSVVAHRTDST